MNGVTICENSTGTARATPPSPTRASRSRAPTPRDFLRGCGVPERTIRAANFKENIDHFASGTIKKPLTTFGNVKADVLALKDISYTRMNFCSIILGSKWPT
ncbi:hypothetical protein FBZ93_101503 [Bradyrhizobium macuxiense]|uniref:Uncharacterized protein n=1 Tax=Bradyrhizobium macuxiense TaxID=1755647 RepID=A0A560MIK4_9BRAD|nr:hypothetical protein FBZ93_101503 [Bradyrhizobium macuxiense]